MSRGIARKQSQDKLTSLHPVLFTTLFVGFLLPLYFELVRQSRSPLTVVVTFAEGIRRIIRPSLMFDHQTRLWTLATLSTGQLNSVIHYAIRPVTRDNGNQFIVRGSSIPLIVITRNVERSFYVRMICHLFLSWRPQRSDESRTFSFSHKGHTAEDRINRLIV